MIKRCCVVLLLCCVFGLFYTGCPTPIVPVPLDAGPPDSKPPKGQTAFVISMWEESGSFGSIDVSTQVARKNIGPLSNDAVARYHNGFIYIINRLTHDNIQVVNAKTWAFVKQYSVEPRSNPQDIAIIGDKKAYISRLASPKLLIVNPKTGERLGDVDLSQLAEVGTSICATDSDCKVASNKCLNQLCTRDGVPELSRMHLYDDKLFVVAQRLNRNQRFAALDRGMLAVIDVKTNKLLKTILLAGKNPTNLVAMNGGKTLYIGQVGNWVNGSKAVLDGLIEKIDLVSMTSKGVVLRERELGGNLSSFVLLSEQKGYAIRSTDKWQTELVSFELQAGKLGKLGKILASSPCLTEGACFSFFQMALNQRNEIYLADRHIKAPGIRIFDGNSGSEITKKPIDMGLPPSFVLFYP